MENSCDCRDCISTIAFFGQGNPVTMRQMQSCPKYRERQKICQERRLRNLRRSSENVERAKLRAIEAWNSLIQLWDLSQYRQIHKDLVEGKWSRHTLHKIVLLGEELKDTQGRSFHYDAFLNASEMTFIAFKAIKKMSE